MIHPRIFKYGIVLIVFASFLAACSGNGSEPSPESPAAQPSPSSSGPIAVSTARSIVRQVPAYIQTTGNLNADETSDVSPQIPGQVVATHADVGDFVAQGAVIARLDDRDARLRLQQQMAAQQRAAAAVRQAEARIGLLPGQKFDPEAVPDVRTARASWQQRQAERRLAEANAQRYANLAETGDVSRSLYDQQRTQAETARAQETAARQQHEAALNQARQNFQAIAAERASLEAARAETALMEKSLDDTRIRAPFAGYISDRPVAAGEYVTNTSKIATVVRANPIKLILQSPKGDAAKLRLGMSVEASVAAYPNRWFTGRVTAINPAVDLQSRVVSVEVEIGNSENLLRTGMFATARIIQPGGTEGVFIPREAVMADQLTDSSSVYVIEGDTARLRVVSLGEEQDGLVMLKSGVAKDEVVAIGNLNELYDGAKVQRQSEK